ncbi:MAG TPA: 3-isopropylmalate dehydratase large subunit [Holophagaceae bacterium]|nr:3-isopropylmalate dehydratase large subunit [Holophagaceae bacterium]
MMPRTLYDKLWDRHLVSQREGEPALLYIDLHLIHEVTSPQAFAGLRERRVSVRRPGLTVATLDHSLPTHDRALPIADAVAAKQIALLRANAEAFGIPLHAPGSGRQGIVHVIGPELGLTQPGMTVVCGDSHTATHGAFGALAFGIGTSEVEMVLATQCLLQRKSKNLKVEVSGRLQDGVTAKDLILALIAKLGVGGGTGSVLEYTGEAIRALDMEARMTLCNMSIEAGARAGLIAPDDTTFQYLRGRPFAPRGAAWDAAVADWRALVSDDGASYEGSVHLDGGAVEPMITFGTNPAQAVPVTGSIPAVSEIAAPEREAFLKALAYMGLEPGKPMLGRPVQAVFIGSCTNGRLSDLRAAASVLRGRRVKAGVRTLVVPGSEAVRKQAEAEGLDEVFRAAGAEWREPGCSMCIAMNGDELAPGQTCVSTSNRNFEGRQGRGSRTLLASPLTAAAAAIAGAVADARRIP